MQTAIFKLSFSTAVHFGEGALDSCASTLMSDTLFSALCIEAIKYERLDRRIPFTSVQKFQTTSV